MQTIKRYIEGTEVIYGFFTTMHTRCDLLLYGEENHGHLEQVCSRIEEELFGLELKADPFNPESEVYHLNQLAPLHPTEVSEDLYDMISICLSAHRLTEGFFDITVNSEGHDSSMIRKIILDSLNKTVSFSGLNTKVDLCGFAKGYALDRIRDILVREDIRNALVNLGNSSILAVGNQPHGYGWKVGYGKEWANAPVVLHDGFLTTSGNDTENRRHIINPQTERLEEGRRGVGILSPTGSAGEILSTSLFISRNPERRERILKNYPGSTFFDLIL